MTGVIATTDDGAWTAIEHTNAISDEDQQRWISTLLGDTFGLGDECGGGVRSAGAC